MWQISVRERERACVCSCLPLRRSVCMCATKICFAFIDSNFILCFLLITFYFRKNSKLPKIYSFQMNADISFLHVPIHLCPLQLGSSEYFWFGWNDKFLSRHTWTMPDFKSLWQNILASNAILDLSFTHNHNFKRDWTCMRSWWSIRWCVCVADSTSDARSEPAGGAVGADSDAHPLNITTNIDPNEIPPVPGNRFLARAGGERDTSVKGGSSGDRRDAETRSRHRRRMSTDIRAGKKIKGRGFLVGGCLINNTITEWFVWIDTQICCRK